MTRRVALNVKESPTTECFRLVDLPKNKPRLIIANMCRSAGNSQSALAGELLWKNYISFPISCVTAYRIIG